MNLNPFEILSRLAECEKVDSRLMVRTTYGLIVEATADGAVDVRLSDPVHAEAASSTITKPGYHYYFWPDYTTSFVWYRADWEGNPGDETHLEEEDLKERYGEAWQKALKLWVDKYTQAFEAHEYHLGSRKEPFPDSDERAAWVVEGVLLAAWLALQPGVDAVEFEDEGGTCICWLEKVGLSVTLEGFLKDLGEKGLEATREAM